MTKDTKIINKILDCVRETFADIGFKDITMSEIIDAAEMDREDFYKYFTSPEEIFVEMFFKRQRDIKEKVEELLREDKTAIYIVESFIDEQFIDLLDFTNFKCINIYEFYFDHGEYLEINFLEFKYNNEIHLLSKILEYGIERNELKPMNVKTVSETIVLLLEGIRILKETTDLENDIILNQKKNVLNLIENYL